ncbi:hypothetical protein ACFY1L_24135 [Streptomyces sp. NPDC001663]|uniref:hypothetical protein n=1 Tax=Streptomyces sp. NPDC001663 TaxID=3364597 RepID=UPI0036C32471
MADLLDRIMRLWMDPPVDDEAAVAAFRELYADPVPVNGEPMSAADLLARARALHRAYDGLRHELVKEVGRTRHAGRRLPDARQAHRSAEHPAG